MCPVWLRLVSVVPLVLMTACPPAGQATESTTLPETTTSQAMTDPELTTTTGDCQVGMAGCACTGGGACDPGLECNAERVCEPKVVTTETMTTEPPSTSSTTEDTTDDASDATTEPVGRECTPVGDGLESAECIALDPSRPFCDVDTCKPCGDLPPDVCVAGTDGERPICHPSGKCVQCDAVDALAQMQCGAATPHCNLDTNACEGCFEHSECPDTACDIAARKCFPKNNVLYIRMGGECSAKSTEGGWEEFPFCDFPTALQNAKDNRAGGYTFHLLGNLDNTSPGALTVAPGGPPVSYAFVHAPGGPGEAHTQFFDKSGPLLVVGSNVTLYIKEFKLELSFPQQFDFVRGIDCQEGASVWLDDSRVVGAYGPNIRGNGCKIHLRRSVVGLGRSEGIDMTGGSLFAVNSYITHNSHVAGLGGGGLRMRGGATADINFSTIAFNASEPNLGLGDSIQCDDDQVSIKIRNSIIASKPGQGNVSIVCAEDAITVDDSSVDTVVPGDNTKSAAENLLDALLEAKMTGITRLNPDGEWLKYYGNRAQWQPGDPHFDFEFEPRDTTLGVNSVVGADVLP